jgi:hypothetical protein
MLGSLRFPEPTGFILFKKRIQMLINNLNRCSDDFLMDQFPDTIGIRRSPDLLFTGLSP